MIELTYVFKGKRSGDGKWVQGYYVYCRGHNYILPVDERKKEFGFDSKHDEWIEVYTESICKYSGLNDKNDKMIFSGDIVHIPDYGDYVVKFEYGQFCIGLNLPLAYKRYDCEIIGNIFDNPELQKAYLLSVDERKKKFGTT